MILAAEDGRLAGTDGDLAEEDLHPRLVKRLLHEIMGPHRDSPGEQEQIGRESLVQGQLQVGRIVPHDPLLQRVGAEVAACGGEERAVAVPDLPRARLEIRLHQLVAGRDHGHAGAAMDQRVGLPYGGQDAEAGGGQQVAARQNLVSRLELAPLLRHVRSPGHRLQDENPAPVPCRPGRLHLLHRIGPLGKRRSGHDPGGLSLLDSAAGKRSRGYFLHDFQLPRQRRQVGAAQREAIHHRFGEGGLVGVGGNVRGQHATGRALERSALGAQHARLAQDDAEGLLHRDHGIVGVFHGRRRRATITRKIPE